MYDELPVIQSLSHDWADVLNILQHSPSVELAAGPEGLLYRTELAHNDPVVRKWMRQVEAVHGGAISIHQTP